MSRLRLTPAARADLDSIWDYTVSTWDMVQAEAYLQTLLHTMQTLADTPGLGRSIEDIRPGYLKFPAASHVIYYRSCDGGIDVIRILHKRMDVDRHI